MCVISENVEHIAFAVPSGYLLQHFWLQILEMSTPTFSLYPPPPFAAVLADFLRLNEEAYEHEHL